MLEFIVGGLTMLLGVLVGAAIQANRDNKKEIP